MKLVPWTRQPQKFARSSVPGLWGFWFHPVLADAVVGFPAASKSGSAGLVGTPAGLGWNIPSGTSYVDHSQPPNGLDEGSLIVVMNQKAAVASVAITSRLNSNTSSQGIEIVIDSGTAYANSRSSFASANTSASPATGLNNGQLAVHIATFNRFGNLEHWVNGRKVGSVSSGGGTLGHSRGIRYGDRDGTRLAGVDFLACGYATRKLTDAECATLGNPSAVFSRLLSPQRIFLPAYVAAGGAFTLPLDAGSYAQTGQEASLVVSRNLSFDNGTYAFNGQPTTVVVSRNLTFDAGSYTVSGQNAEAVVSRQLSFDAGAYSYLGQDVTLTYDSSSDTYTLALEAGSYTYTGQSTGLSAARKLGFDAGSYSYSGQPISVTVSRQISFDAGLYNATGQTTTFKVSRNLVADSGAYTYTGQTTGLTYSGASFVTIKAGSWLRYRVI